MTICFDVVHLEDTICVSSKDLKKQGSLRYYMLFAFLAMVQIFHALHALWVTLFPFALLWWNVMLHATCAKYYSWNRSLLRLQTTGQRFCGNIIRESCSFSEASIAEETCLSPHQRGSSADASHADNREISILSLLRQTTCAGAAKQDVGSIPLQHRKSHHPIHGFGFSIQSFPDQNGLHMLDPYDNIAAACPENSGSQFEERISSETTSRASKAQVRAASSSASKLSSLCLLEGRQPQPSGLLKCGVFSFLLPHQVPPLAMLDVHVCPRIPSEHFCLQVHLHRNGNMVDLKVPMLIDHVSANWPMLREWLQTFNGGCVPALDCGNFFLDLAWNSSKLLASQTRNDNYAILHFILSTSEGFNIFNTMSSHDVVESVKLRIREQWSLWDLSRFKMKKNITYVDNEGSGSDCIEDLGSVCCASIKSDDGCDGTYCTDVESSSDRDDRFDDSGVVYGNQCYQDDGYSSNCYPGYEDSGTHSAEDAEDVYGSFVHPAMDKDDSFYDCSADCNVGYHGLHCVTDVDDFCGMDYDAADCEYNNFEGNIEGSGAVFGDFHFAYEDGVNANPLEIKQIHVAKANTWWDDDAVLVGKQESEEDSIEQEWQVV